MELEAGVRSHRKVECLSLTTSGWLMTDPLHASGSPSDEAKQVGCPSLFAKGEYYHSTEIAEPVDLSPFYQIKVLLSITLIPLQRVE